MNYRVVSGGRVVRCVRLAHAVAAAVLVGTVAGVIAFFEGARRSPSAELERACYELGMTAQELYVVTVEAIDVYELAVQRGAAFDALRAIER